MMYLLVLVYRHTDTCIQIQILYTCADKNNSRKIVCNYQLGLSIYAGPSLFCVDSYTLNVISFVS